MSTQAASRVAVHAVRTDARPRVPSMSTMIVRQIVKMSTVRCPRRFVWARKLAEHAHVYAPTTTSTDRPNRLPCCVTMLCRQFRAGVVRTRTDVEAIGCHVLRRCAQSMSMSDVHAAACTCTHAQARRGNRAPVRCVGAVHDGCARTLASTYTRAHRQTSREWRLWSRLARVMSINDMCPCSRRSSRARALRRCPSRCA